MPEKSSGKTGSNELDKMADPDIPEDHATDEVAALDSQLNASLAKFDGLLLEEMDEIRAGSSGKLQDLAAEAAEAAKRLREKGLDVDTSGSKSSGKSGEPGKAGKAPKQPQEMVPARAVKAHPARISAGGITKMTISWPASCAKPPKMKRIPSSRKSSGKNMKNIKRSSN